VNLARGLERRLEGLVEGLAAKLFRGSVQPAELATRLVREADLSLADGPAGPVAPNLFGVRMNPADLGADDVPEAISEELARVVQETAIERGWRLEGRVVVEVMADSKMASGALDIASSVAPTSVPAWARLVPATGDPIDVAPNRCLIGRGDDCDAVIRNDATSRYHSLVWREAGKTWVADLESSNGTTLNRVLVMEPTELKDGDALTFGEAAFKFRVA